MKPLAIFINIAGPIKHPEHGLVHQVEFGVQQKGGKPEAIRLIDKTSSTDEAMNNAVKLAKNFVQKYYPKQASKPEPPENLINLNNR